MGERELIKKMLKFLGVIDNGLEGRGTGYTVSYGYDEWGEEEVANIEDAVDDILKIIDTNGFEIVSKLKIN